MQFAIPTRPAFTEMSNKLEWHKIAESEAELPFASNGIAVVIAGNKKHCLARKGDKLYAFAFTCPHAGAPMTDGYLDAIGNVVCPSHRYKFDITNGRNVSGEGYFLKTRPVEIRADGIYIGVEHSGLFGLW
jgi:nitrite reductase/ring-hydroxylating ferredoxin subunit